MPRHDVDAEPVAGPDHVLAPGPERGARSLPRVPSVEQQRVTFADLGAQALNQCLEVSEPPDLAVFSGRLREIEITERVPETRIGRYARRVEQGFAHEVRRPAPRITDAEIDIGLAEIDRQQLRMAIGEMYQARLPERRRGIKVLVPRTHRARGRSGCDSGDGQDSQEFSSVHGRPAARLLDDPALPGLLFPFGLLQCRLRLEARLVRQLERRFRIAGIGLGPGLLQQVRRGYPLVAFLGRLHAQAFGLLVATLELRRATRGQEGQQKR